MNRAAEPPKHIRAAGYSAATSRFIAERFAEADAGSSDAGLLVLRLANAFQQDSEKRIHRPLGLRWTGFSTLFALLIFERLEANTLARLIGVSRQAVSTVLSTLERDGFIDRRPGEDRRTLIIELTGEGRRVAMDGLRGQIQVSEDWFGALEPDERVQLVELLGRVMRARRAPAPDVD